MGRDDERAGRPRSGELSNRLCGGPADRPLRSERGGITVPKPAGERHTSAGPRLLDLQQVAEHLNVKERHIRRLVAERRIPFVKWGHLLRFDPEEIAAWLDAARCPPAPPPSPLLPTRSNCGGPWTSLKEDQNAGRRSSPRRKAS